MTHLLYPSDSLNPKISEEQYLPEIEAAKAAGFEVSLVSLEYLQIGERCFYPQIPRGASVLYRGYMLDEEAYKALAKFVGSFEAMMHTSLEEYLGCHHLPNWYPLIADLTMETRIFSESSDLVAELEKLGWPGYFLKDYVKSLKTGAGSRISNPGDATDVVADMKKYRGKVEGGICVRRLVEIELESEARFFVVHGRVFSSAGGIPGIEETVAERIRSPFYSVDVARTVDGRTMVVEVGDGQVSGTVGWDVRKFVDILPR